jgi:hypothetical protein
MSAFIQELKSLCDAEWRKISNGLFFKLIRKPELQRELYVRAMVEVFHYTKHNAINQAAATFNADHRKAGLLLFAIKHALEEVGHENMVVNDLASIGVDAAVFQRPPMPATEALSGYLYSLSIRGGIIPRLGYSFWAEDSYEYMAPLLEICQRDMGLTEQQMTFFIAHASIDEKHSADVNHAIEQWVVTEEDKAAVRQVARTTLFLTGQIMESVARDVAEEYGDEYLA